MDKKKKFQNDPAKFFMYQDRLLTDEERQKSVQYHKTVIDLQKCPICNEEYDLAAKAPRILIHCGHTVCTDCLYLFFKDQKIRCPLCAKTIKRLKLVEVLPLNHLIYNMLTKLIPDNLVDPINMRLMLPYEMAEEFTEQEDYQFPLCSLHNDRIQHFVCLNHNLLLCRACIIENYHYCRTSIVDLYSLRHEVVKDILYRLDNLVLLERD